MEQSRDTQASQEPTSLVLRLAGPSTTKAGYVGTSCLYPPLGSKASHASLSTEQTEINRIIADASKGSKFYEVHLVAIQEYAKHLRVSLAFTSDRMKSGKTRK